MRTGLTPLLIREIHESSLALQERTAGELDHRAALSASHVQVIRDCDVPPAAIIIRVSYTLRPRLRVTTDDGTIVLGPGKADLLEAVERTGSIRAAADELRMSYMRAWTLIRTMNSACRSPLVEKERGGKERGGAQLTERGRTVLRLYREMEEAALRAVDPFWEKLREEL